MQKNKGSVEPFLNQYQLNRYINVDVDFCPYKI